MVTPDSDELIKNEASYQEFGRSLFRKISDTCRSNHSKCLVTTTGVFDSSNLNKQNILIDPTQAFLKDSKEFFKSIDIPYFDISENILKQTKENPKKQTQKIHMHR